MWPPPPKSCGRPLGVSAPTACSPSCPSCSIGSPCSGELTPAPAVDKLLRQASAATLGRLLAPARSRYPVRGATTTPPGTWLKHEIPIRTFTDWDDAEPGFLEIDLVAHCGSSTLGFYLCTLCTVDIVTCWVELEAVWGKGQERVGGAVQHVHARLQMPLLGLDSDNGSEFINQGMYAYCQRHALTFTRSRAWQKNDSAHVEQKNGAVVRGLVGYDRYTSKAAYAQLARVYRLARLHVNFFQPVQKLVRENPGRRPRAALLRHRADPLSAPLRGRRPLARQTSQLATVYTSLNPVLLRRDLDRALERLWTLAAPDNQRAATQSPTLSPARRVAPGGS